MHLRGAAGFRQVSKLVARAVTGGWKCDWAVTQRWVGHRGRNDAGCWGRMNRHTARGVPPPALLKPSAVLPPVLPLPAAAQGELVASLVSMVGAIALPVLVLALMSVVVLVIRVYQRQHWQLFSDRRVAEETVLAISELRLEDVAWLADIPHPNRIQRAFMAIVAKLKELSAYIPTSLLAQGGPSPRLSLVNEDWATVSSSARSSGTDLLSPAASAVYRCDPAPSGRPCERDPTPQMPPRRVVTMVVSCALDPGEPLAARHLPELQALVERFVSLTLQQVREHAGVLEFGGDAFELVGLWNTARPCRAPEIKAVQAAWGVHVALSELCAAVSWGMQYSIGVADSVALYSNFGTAEMRKCCAYGTSLQSAKALAALAYERRHCPPLLLTAAVSEKSATVMQVCGVGQGTACGQIWCLTPFPVQCCWFH